MTDREFISGMITLVEEMCEVYNNEPIDQVDRQAILDEVHRRGDIFNRSRRRFSCWTRWIIFALTLLLAWLVYTILF